MNKRSKDDWSSKDKTLKEISKLYGNRKSKLLNKTSPAESHFEKILREQSDYYIREKAFMDNGFLCYVDFYFPFQNLAIEIDGPEHNTKKAQFRDKVKSDFILENRGTVTYRITNEDCLSMESINIDEIAEQAWIDSGRGSMMEWRRTKMPSEYFKWMTEMNSRTSVDLRKPIYAYSKVNDKVYSFADCYFMRKCTDMSNKDILRNLEHQDNFINGTNFIIADNIDDLSKRIAIYYNNVRNKSFKDKRVQENIARRTREMDVTKFDEAIKVLTQAEELLKGLRNVAPASVFGKIDLVLHRTHYGLFTLNEARDIVTNEQ